MSRRHQSLAAAVAALCLLAAAPGFAQEYSYARVVRLSLVEGDVQVHRPEAGDWEAALVNLPLQQGYLLATGQGRAEVELESGATARLAEDTMLEFAELALSDGSRITRLKLTEGTATFYANISKQDVFVVLTPHLETSISKNSRFRLDVDSGGTAVRVLKGDISVESSAGTHRLSKGHTLLFRQAAEEQVSLARNVEPDEWDRWVADRDEVVSSSRSASLRYVSTPFQYGVADLSHYGSWNYLGGYGHVWQPRGVPTGWSPYWDGRWMFVRGIGWTWVSYEPWGWVPYHYGRWTRSHLGWVWIPGYFNSWHPGLVFWLQVGDRVGWCPLGPRDRFDQFPRNPGGVIVNTPRGVVGGSPNQRGQINPSDRPRWIGRAPAALDDFLANNEDRGIRGRATPAAGVPGQTDTVAPPAAPATGQIVRPPRVPLRGRTTETGDIVYDGQDRRYVNNPTAPVRRTVPEDADVRAPRGYATGRAVTGEPPRAPRVDQQDARPGDRVPTSRGWTGRAETRAPRSDSSDTYRPPRPTAPTTTRTEAPRSAPAPRVESRPAPSPPRTVSPRAPSTPHAPRGEARAPRTRQQ